MFTRRVSLVLFLLCFAPFYASFGAEIVEVPVSTGTGWVVNPGYIVTNYHVIEGGRAIEIQVLKGDGLDERPLSGEVYLSDPAADLALIAVNEKERLPKALPLAHEMAHLGTSLFTIGFPKVNLYGYSPKLRIGLLSSLLGLNDDPVTFETSVRVEHGSSGGPLVNLKGEVVGIVGALLGVEAPDGSVREVESVSYGIKVEALRKLLSHVKKERVQWPEVPAEKSEGTPEKVVNRVLHSVVLVRTLMN